MPKFDLSYPQLFKFLKEILNHKDRFNVNETHENCIYNALGLGISDRPKTLYKFGHDFASELQKTSITGDLSLVIKQEMLGAFRFLDSYIFTAVIIFDRDSDIRRFTSDGKRAEGTILAVIVFDDGRDIYFRIPFGKELPLEEFDYSNLESFSDKERRIAMSRLINGIVYINSGNPDLREYKRPTKEDKLSRKEKDRLVSLYGTEDAILVSWDWKKPRIYREGAWVVDGHGWWKPHGPNRSLRTWDWRTGHIRQRKPTDKCTDQHEESACD
jgi:hypothetical protein